MRHSHRAATALAHLGEQDPALALLGLWCTHRDGGPATATRDDTIFYGSDFAELPLREQVGLAAHHILHVALRHSPRARDLANRFRDGFEPELYGLAADAIVNETLSAAEHPLPRPAVTLTELLETIGEAPTTAVAALSDWDTERLYWALVNTPERQAAARGYARKTSFRPDLEPHGDINDPSSADWHGHVARAISAGQQAGYGIGMVAGFLADLSPPRIPWERHLRRLVQRAIDPFPRRSLRRPSNRWIAAMADAAHSAQEPVFEPGWQRDRRRPRIAIALDTSSSVDDATLGLFASETAGIARRTGAVCIVLGFDTEVHTEREMDGSDWETRITAMTFRRGGGTSFVPVVRRLAKIDPSVAVILTDLNAPHGPQPACPVVWAVPDSNAIAEPPPYGTVLPLQ